MAEKKSWRDYTSGGTEDKEDKSDKKTSSWRDYLNSAEIVGKNVTGKVNEWLKGHNSYITDYQQRFSGRKGTYEDAYVSDSADWLNSATERKTALDAEANSILSYLDQYGGHLDANWVQKVRKTINDAKGTQKQILTGAHKDNEYWNSFASEDLVKEHGSAEEAYKYYQFDAGNRSKYEGLSSEDLKWAAGLLEDGNEKDWLNSYIATVDYDEKANYDISFGEYEIKSLEDKIQGLENAYYMYHEILDQPEYADIDAYNQKVAELFGKYGGSPQAMDKYIHDQEELLKEKKQYLESAKKVQELEKWNRYTKEADFDEYAAKGAEIKNPSFEEAFGTWIGPWQLGGEDIGNIVTFSRDNYNNIASSSEGGKYNTVGNLLYNNMTEDEVKLYNYLLAKEGKEVANSYLSLLEPALKDAEGKRMADRITGIDIPVIEDLMVLGTGFGAGVENWYNSAESFFTGEEISPSILQYQNAYIGESLDGKFGQYAHQAATTMGNMAPSILVSTVLGGAGAPAALAQGVGAATMGVSAAGGAYSDALAKGYDKASARAYSTLVGASEGTLQYLLGGIGKLGGLSGKFASKIAAIDSGLLRASAKLGLNIVSEIAEEELQNYLEPAFRTIIFGEEYDAPTIEELIETAIVTALSTGVLEGGEAIGSTVAEESLKKQYGGSTKELIQEGLLSDVNSESYQLAQQYKQKIDGGKTLTGAEIRQLVEANEKQISIEDFRDATSDAKSKLQTLGETENVDKIAKLVAKRVTGQELTRAEISTLARSQYGAQVAKEMREANQTESGAKSFDVAYKSDATYNSLESRVDTETPAKVSDTGKAVIRGTDEEIDLTNPKIKQITKDSVILDVDGKDVDIDDIEFANEDQWNVFNALKKVEHITPLVASDMVAKVDLTKPVWSQMNGMDEAYTYGFYGYSEADLNAGLFTGNLTKEQLNDAYKLGQYERGKSDMDSDAPRIKMRTEAEAKLSKKEKTAKQKARIESDDVEVYFQDGKKTTKFDEHTGKYDDKRMAAVNTAKFLSKLGIGGKYYFYESYVNDDGVRVYKDANGNEVEAPNGMYKAADGSIHIDLNAGDMGQGTALFTMGHELGHFVKDQSKKQFKVLSDLITEAFAKTDMSMHERVLAKQKFLEDKRGKKVSYDEAFEEVVCDALSTMLTDGSFYDKLMEIKVKDKGLFATIKRFFQKMIAKFNKAYEELTPDQKDAQDIRAMKDMFDKIQTAFSEALVEASENFQASEQALAQAGIAVNAETDSGSLLSVRDVLNENDRKKVAKALADRFNVTEKEAMDWLKAETSLASVILNPKYSAFLDYEADPNEVAIKQNSDYPQGTVDFSNICKKRREFTQVMNRVLRNFPNHVFAATDLAKIRTIMGEEGMTLPCGICYVEDRRQLDSIVAQDFIDGLKLYREDSKTRPDGKPFNANQIKGLQLTDGDTYVPSIYELVTLEGRNSLKEKNPNMEAAWVKYNNARGMQAVRLLTNEAEYKRQILKYTPKTVQTKNDYGGLRIYSFSDAEMFHLIDIIQVLTDCAAVGLKVQGYTKVNEYAKAVKDTGEKLNRSLIPLGDLGYHMENGKVVLDYDTVEGIDINSKDFFDSKDNPNVGNIVIGINPTQIRAAMVSDFIDYIIPFHTGQSAEVLGEKGIAEWVNYKDTQSEIDLATGKKSAHQINIYTEVFQAAEDEGKPIRNKRDFVDKFLAVCKENGLKPRFSEFLNMDANGDYVYTEGYHKFLVDFKTFAQTEVGEYLPQMPVKPTFDNAYITSLLETYVQEQQSKDAEVAKQMPKVIERITNEIIKQSDVVKNSDRSQKWKPKLDNIEWGIVNYAIEHNQGTAITSTCNMFFKKSKGRTLFGIYSTEDSTLLYASREQVAEKEHIFVDLLREEFKNGNVTDTSAEGLRAWAKTVRMQRVANDNHGSGNVAPGRSAGNAELHGRPSGLYTSAALRNVLENIFQKEAAGRTGDGNVRKSDRDSTGKQLTKEQQEFFKDSKVRDENGNLLVMYHGTKNGDFTVFDHTKAGKRTGFASYGKGNYFTVFENGAAYYGGRVIPAYLKIVNPVVTSANRGAFFRDVAQALGVKESEISLQTVSERIKEAGYDGVIVHGIGEDEGNIVICVAYDSAQIKEVSNKKPTSNPDIRYSERGEGSSNRSLLANAFEGITKSSIEYKMIQDYKGHIQVLNMLDKRLSVLNDQIRETRFTKGKYDAEKLRELESERAEVISEINRHDKKLLSLEASEPLRKVIERERKKEAQKTKAHVQEIQQNKKVRAEQTELRHKIRKTIRDLDKILNRGNKKQNVKEDLQPVVTKALQAAEILFTENYGSYDMLRNGIGADLSDAEEALVESCAKMLKNLDKMPTDGYENFQARQEAENRLKTKMSKLKDVFARERKRLNNTTVSSILGELADAYASLEKSEQSYVQGAYSEPVHNFLKNLQSEVGGTIVMDMTKDQLESVYAAYKMVLTTVRKANQMFNEGLKMSREQLGNAVIEEVLKAGGVHLLGTKMGDAISQFDWNNMKPVWVANRIGSESFAKLMQGLFDGQYNFARDIDEVKQFKLSMDEKYKPRNWDAEKQYEFESSTGKKFSLNLQQIMSLYAFSKREQAYSHLLNGGFVFEENSTVVVDGKLGIKRTYIHKGAASYKLNEATLNGILNSLTAEQKAYVDEMQKYLSDVMGAKGNEVSMQLYGIKMFNEKFYFPLRSSGAYMEKAKEAELKKQQGQINLVNSGFTHSVKPEAKNPIVLSGFMDVWAEHCNEMSMYHSMVLPMEDFRKVYNYSTIHDENMESASVYQTIQDAYGKAATDYIDQLYKELNAGATVDPRETPYKKLISNFKKSAVMLSGSVVVQQFSSIGRAYAVIDPKYFIGAKVKSDTKLSTVDEMKKYAPVAIIKEMGGFDTGTKGNATAYIKAEKYGKGERIKGLVKDNQYRGDIMGYLPAKADELTWCAIWEAVKRETKANHPKMDVKSDEFLKLAGERFSEVIEKTQVYDSVLARSANMRSKGNFMQMATAFMAEPTTTINLVEDAIRSGKARNVARVFGSVAVSIILNNALASIVYAMRDDDEDETLIEKYFQSFTSGLIDDINPMSYYPFLKDVYSLFQGYDVERSDMSVIADVRDAMKQVYKYISEDTSEMDDDDLAKHNKNLWGAFGSLLDAGCSVFGVPVKNVRRDANGLVNGIKTIGTDLSGERTTTWLSFWDKVGSAAKDTIPIYAWTKDESKTSKLYRAIAVGDKEYLSRLKSTYKTDSAYQSAVRKALRENDPRIQEAAQARYDGKTEEYKRIFREIQNEGKFSFDDIMSAINTELSKLEPDKVSSEYSARGFVEAVAMGNTSEANAMRDDIIATHIANGKTQDEAEEAFASAVSTGIHDAYSSGLLDEAGAEKMLVEYADKDEDEAASKVSYWAFMDAHPEHKDVLTEARVEKYHEFAEPAAISVDVYAQFINGTKDLTDIKDEWGDVEVTKREQVLEVIHSLPLTWQQKDALYLAYGYAESQIWDVPW